jgi:hypothetical protein
VDTQNRPGEPQKYAQASFLKNAALLGGKTEAERNSELLAVQKGKSIAAQEAKKKNFNQYPFYGDIYDCMPDLDLEYDV